MVSLDNGKFSTQNDARAEKRKEALDQSGKLVEEGADEQIARYKTVKKESRYKDDLELLRELDPGFRGDIDYKLLGNKTLSVTGDGEITRERGYRTKTRKVTRLNAETGQAYVAKLQTENGRKKETSGFDRDGQLTEKRIERKDGRYSEKWERDEDGSLMRTAYQSSRWRDGNIRAVKEEMSGPLKREDGTTYRRLTRKKGSSEKVYERDRSGNLELVKRTTRMSSMLVRKASDGKRNDVEVKKANGLFAKSYRARLDEKGKEIGFDVTAHRRLLNKRSATYDEQSGKMTTAKHTVGKLYKSETAFAGGDVKIVTRKILGLKVNTRRELLSSKERNAQNLRIDQARQQQEAWAKPSAPQQVKTTVTETDVSAKAPAKTLAAPPTTEVRQPSPKSVRLESQARVETSSRVASDNETSSLSSWSTAGDTAITTPDISPAPSRATSISEIESQSNTMAPANAQSAVGEKIAVNGNRNARETNRPDLPAKQAPSNAQALLGAPDPSKPAPRPALREVSPQAFSAKDLANLESALATLPETGDKPSASVARNEVMDRVRNDRDRGSSRIP